MGALRASNYHLEPTKEQISASDTAQYTFGQTCTLAGQLTQWPDGLWLLKFTDPIAVHSTNPSIESWNSVPEVLLEGIGPNGIDYFKRITGKSIKIDGTLSLNRSETGMSIRNLTGLAALARKSRATRLRVLSRCRATFSSWPTEAVTQWVNTMPSPEPRLVSANLVSGLSSRRGSPAYEVMGSLQLWNRTEDGYELNESNLDSKHTNNKAMEHTDLRTHRTPVRLAFANHMNRFVTGDVRQAPQNERKCWLARTRRLNARWSCSRSF